MGRVLAKIVKEAKEKGREGRDSCRPALGPIERRLVIKGGGKSGSVLFRH
jgi:hypothetical protein